jgi:hypothetical protein
MATGRVPTTANSPLTAKGDLFGYSTTQARVAVGNDGETLVADSSTSTGLRYTAGTVQSNPVLNSAYQVWQRGTSVSIAASTVVYTADRWTVLTGVNQATTVSRQATGDSTNLPSIQYCARFQRDSGQTGTTNYSFANSFETVNSIPYAGKTVTVSFYARKGADYTAASDALFVGINTATGTDQRVHNYTTGVASPIGSTVTLTSTWQRFSASGTLSATLNEMAVFFRYTPVGTASTNDYFEVTGVQIDIGSVALPFRTNGETFQGELAACQRYYFQTGAGVSASSSTARVYPLGVALSTTQMVVSIPFAQTMRINPTAVSYNNIRAYDSGGFITVTSFTFQAASTSYANIALNAASGFTANRPTFPAQDGVAGYIAFSAEL